MAIVTATSRDSYSISYPGARIREDSIIDFTVNNGVERSFKSQSDLYVPGISTAGFSTVMNQLSTALWDYPMYVEYLDYAVANGISTVGLSSSNLPN